MSCNIIHTCRWARQGAPQRGTSRCESLGWSGKSWDCRRWWRGIRSLTPPPRPAWWHAGTQSKTAPCPRTPSPEPPRRAWRTESTGCASGTCAHKWTCARCREGWTWWRKLQWELAACSPFRPSLLWDPWFLRDDFRFRQKKWMDGLDKSANQPYGTVKALLMKRRGSGCKFTPFPHVFVMQSPWDVASLGTNKKIENNSTFIQNLAHVDKSAEAATAQLGSQLHNRDKILKKMSAHGKMPVRSSPADLCKMLELSFGSTLTEVTPGRSAGTGRKQASVKTIGGFGH